MKLTSTHEIIEKRKVGTIHQQMDIVVEYNPEEDDFEVLEVWVSQDGKGRMEISELLDNAEGNPLNHMVTEINWREIYRNQLNEEYA